MNLICDLSSRGLAETGEKKAVYFGLRRDEKGGRKVMSNVEMG